MKSKSNLVSSTKKRGFSPTRSRSRKRHKRLDAICENVYNQNHNDHNLVKSRDVDGQDSQLADTELRRSSRVRRRPVVLDVSPSPVKKRKTVGKNVSPRIEVGGLRRLRSVKLEENSEVVGGDLDDTPGSWKSRLRARGRKGGSGKGSEVKGRRRLFDELEIVGRRVGKKERELDGGKSMLLRSKRHGRYKTVSGSGDGGKTGGLNQDEDFDERDNEEMKPSEDENEIDKNEVVAVETDEELPVLANEVGDRTDEQAADGGEDVQLKSDEEEENSSSDSLEEQEASGSFSVEAVDPATDKLVEEIESDQVEGLGGVEDEKRQRESDEASRDLTNEVEHAAVLEGEKVGSQLVDETNEDLRDEIEHQASVEVEKVGSMLVDVTKEDLVNEENGTSTEEQRVSLLPGDDTQLESGKDATIKSNLKNDTTENLGRLRFKQGRRCGLCGRQNDGKPPKRLVQDASESENEAYSGSSASESPSYDIWDGFGDEPGWLGSLLGPVNDRYGITGTWVHQHCAVWSPEVYFAGLGRLKNLRAALCRGRALKCTRCGRPGATIGCRVDRCPKTYHLPCARAIGCIFDHRKFLIACTDHKHLFQPQGNLYSLRVKKLKAKKLKLQLRKISNDAWRKDVEAEERWLENCGEDEEFLKRESKRLHRDLVRIAPVYIGGTDSESGKLFEGWESVAGLQDVIQCMKEVVLIPLLYPEFFSKLGITPPRGVLLHGHPGTGKTLVVRALIGACAHGDKRIAYFARKGADCLGKYVGDAERQLRLLFQVAEKCQPSIIFFDEIDGLAPCRTRQQDQTHSSVVSTLLALMDGLKSRGSVVVIGATNRPDAVDPALRRPGRFDREIYFPLPSVDDRAAILSLHTKKWPKPVTGSLLKWIARRTVGFAGADLQALCTQAAIIALKRNFPLQEVLSAAGTQGARTNRLPLPDFSVDERDWLEALACAPPPCSRREAGIAANDLACSPLPFHFIPFLLKPLSTLLVSLYVDDRLWLPPPFLKAAKLVKSVIVSSLKKSNLSTDRWWLHLDVFLKETDAVSQLQRGLSVAGILIGETISVCSDFTFDETGDDSSQFEPSMLPNVGRHTGLLRSVAFGLKKKAGYRVLVAGSPRSGQRHLASCILHSFVGNVEIQKIDLATISQEGHGDMVQGMTRVLEKCASFQLCMIFMPRIDLWAVESYDQVGDESHTSSVNYQNSEGKENGSENGQVADKKSKLTANNAQAIELGEPKEAKQNASHAWSLFVEQVESICVSTSLVILATSEVSGQELPHKVMQFFKSDVSSSSEPAPSDHAVPWFSVHLDGNLDSDAVINLSATELLRDILQSFVHLIHQRAHNFASSSREYQIREPIPGDKEKPRDSAIGNEVVMKPSHDLSLNPSPTIISKNLKGKSSSLLAVSAFGYQILRYPHFAELCWVTSKLKEGPSADVSGPWKGWPFNSCIIRPSNLSDKGVVPCSPGNVKSKERGGVARGLVAVGLLAYKGMYSSLREVSRDVREILELIVGQVNEKIQAGKDWYLYVRLLSQVAYFEDMVNNWLYSLQSLELDGPMKGGSSKQIDTEHPDNHTPVDNSVQRDECNGNVSNKISCDSRGMEGSHVPVASGNVDSIVLGEGENGGGDANSNGIAAASEGGFVQQSDVPAPSTPRKHLEISNGDVQFTASDTNEQDGSTTGNCEPESSQTLASAAQYSDSLRIVNGSMSTSALCNPGELGALRSSSPCRSCNDSGRLDATNGKIGQENAEPVHSEHRGDSCISPIKTPNLSSDTGVQCMYRCCLGCLYALNGLIQKAVLHKLGSENSKWTAEGVHDVVSSLSVDLLSAVRKLDASNFGDSHNKNPRQGISEGERTCEELQNCPCTVSDDHSVIAKECTCHNSDDGCFSSNAENSYLRLDQKFVFRDGILVSVETNQEESFHCKYEKLCFCSLVESIGSTRK